MTLRELLAAMKSDDNNLPFAWDMPVVFHAEDGRDRHLLSVYEYEGTIHIDIG